jgi:hypothetical protein
LAAVERISPDWVGEPCIVAAPGPSLTLDVVHRCRMARFRQWRVIAVQDAYRLMPWADALYGCDPKWWNIHKDCNGFAAERWAPHDAKDEATITTAQAAVYGLRLIQGEHGDIFSTDPGVIRYGSNSGFQGINLAILKGCKRIVLVGFDMKSTGGKRHFFGDHPKGLLNRTQYEDFIPRFVTAAKHMPAGVKIINATPDSALTCWTVRPLEVALVDDSVRGDRPEPDCRASAGSAG